MLITEMLKDEPQLYLISLQINNETVCKAFYCLFTVK